MIDMREALKRSCNVYFYKLGEELGYAKVHAAAAALRFGQPTGILGGPMEGTIGRGGNMLRHPDEAKLTSRDHGAAYQLAIGQSHVVASPVQMARVYGWIATGKLWTPRLPSLCTSA